MPIGDGDMVNPHDEEEIESLSAEQDMNPEQEADMIENLLTEIDGLAGQFEKAGVDLESLEQEVIGMGAKERLQKIQEVSQKNADMIAKSILSGFMTVISPALSLLATPFFNLVIKMPPERALFAGGAFALGLSAVLSGSAIRDYFTGRKIKKELEHDDGIKKNI